MTSFRLKLPINLYVAIYIYERGANYKYGFFLIKCEKIPVIKFRPYSMHGMVMPLMTEFIKESKLKLKVQDKASLLTDYQMLKPIIKNL